MGTSSKDIEEKVTENWDSTWNKRPKVSTFYLLSGLLLGFAGCCCVMYVLFHAAMNESWNRSVVWLLTGAGFVYYVLFEFDSRFRWPVVAGAVGGIALGTKLFMMGSGVHV